MPDGKPSGVRCAQLTDDNRCLLWGKPERPEVCNRLTPMVEMCGETTEDALRYLYWLESNTTPRDRAELVVTAVEPRRA